jgi:hypothetical protein
MSGPTTILTPFETNVVVGTTAVIAALPANPTRNALIIANNAPTTDPTGAAVAAGETPGAQINVTFGPVNPALVNPLHMPTATTGIPIQAGQTFSLMPYMANNISMGAQVNVIASGAGTPVTFIEF